MIKSPIQQVTDKLQYRAIGIVNGVYIPHDAERLGRGILTDNQGNKIDTVILGKALSLLKKYIDLDKSYFWIVYPKNKTSQNLHLQVAGVWDPYQLKNIENESLKSPSELLKDFNLNENYFSIRGELVYVNAQKKEFVIRICSSPQSKKLKNSNFKLVIKGEISLEFLNNFISLEVIREGVALKLVSYEVVEKSQPKK